MSRKRYKSEEIVNREIEVEIVSGTKAAQASWDVGICEQTCHRRRKEFAGLKLGCWCGRPLVSAETVVNLIGATIAKSVLWLKELLVTREYEPGKIITDEEMHALCLEPYKFDRDWNCTRERCSLAYGQLQKSFISNPLMECVAINLFRTQVVALKAVVLTGINPLLPTDGKYTRRGDQSFIDPSFQI